MQKFIATGRLVRNIEFKEIGEAKIAKFTLAIQRKFKKDGEPDADFINFVAFGKTATVCNSYFTKGMKMEVVGEIRTGSYTNKDGVKVYTTEVAAEEVGFAESKQNGNSGSQSQTITGNEDFLKVADSDIEELPFS